MSRHEENQMSVVLLAGLLLAAVVLSGGVFGLWFFSGKSDSQFVPARGSPQSMPIATIVPPLNPSTEKVHWEKTKRDFLFDDVHVELLNANPGDSEDNPVSNLRLTVINNHKTKIVDFLGWNNESTTLEDEYGNKYKIKIYQPNAKIRVGFYSMNANTPTARRLLPTVKHEFYIWFDAISPTAKEARLTLQGKSIGYDKPIHLKTKVGS